MDAQAPPDSGARLTPQALEALIARRLDALGRDPDLLDPSAVAALVADAGGSGRRLRSSLAATLFLASTEDAPRIDAGLVQRALAAPKPVAAQAVPDAAETPIRPLWSWATRIAALACLAVLTFGLAAYLLRPPAARHAPAPAAAPAPPAPAQVPPPPARVAEKAPAPAGPPEAAPAPPATLAPLPPAVEVRSPPVPAASQPAPAGLPAMPEDPPPAIVLLYPARDPGALDRLRPIALKLQNAGLTDIRAKPVRAPAPRRIVSYFYSGDQKLAATIARTLAGSAWPRLSDTALQPLLVLPPPGLPGRNPGTIEVQLP